MRILQLLVTIQRGDAIGNHALLLMEYLRGSSYEVATYAFHIGAGLGTGKDGIHHVESMPVPNAKDIIIYHLCEESPLNYQLSQWQCKKIAIYHNTTPAHFFAWLDRDVARKQDEGMRSIARLHNTFDCVVADSTFNKTDLVRMGYAENTIVVLPILLDFDDYHKKPDAKVISQYGGDGWTNILFVGRIAPNKKQEDVIRTYAWYHKHQNPKSRLILIGSAFSEQYTNYLHQYVTALGLEHVIFPGHVTFQGILGYYTVADIFLCMSEHEGFCVPLVEAMLFDVPIVAYASTAIPETLEDSGVLLYDKSPVLAGKAINLLLADEHLRQAVLKAQRTRLADFEPQMLGGKFLIILKEVEKSS